MRFRRKVYYGIYVVVIKNFRDFLGVANIAFFKGVIREIFYVF